MGLVCWVAHASGSADELTRLERAVGQVAVQAAGAGEAVFLPRDEASAWAWLPLGIRDKFDSAEAGAAGVSADIRFAFGDPARGPGGFCLTYLSRPALPRRLLSRQDLALLRRLPLPTSRPSR